MDSSHSDVVFDSCFVALLSGQLARPVSEEERETMERLHDAFCRRGTCLISADFLVSQLSQDQEGITATPNPLVTMMP